MTSAPIEQSVLVKLCQGVVEKKRINMDENVTGNIVRICRETLCTRASAPVQLCCFHFTRRAREQPKATEGFHDEGFICSSRHDGVPS
jgi:hypothetical protein